MPSDANTFFCGNEDDNYQDDSFFVDDDDELYDWHINDNDYEDWEF